jgi:molybdopterin biosynthesis enzyme
MNTKYKIETHHPLPTSTDTIVATLLAMPVGSSIRLPTLGKVKTFLTTARRVGVRLSRRATPEGYIVWKCEDITKGEIA